MQLGWALICESFSIDSTTNRISLFNVFEEITYSVVKAALPDATPLLPIPCYIVSLWERSDESKGETCEMRVRITDESSGNLVGLAAALKVSLEDHLRNRAILRLPGIPTTVEHLAPGIRTYVFHIESQGAEDEWEHRSSLRIRMVATELPAPTGNTA